MKDFEILFKEGRFSSNEILTLKYWKIEPEKYIRRAYSKEDLKIGFAVGLKISKSAVKRNRLKRQMREIIRLLLKDDKIKKGYQMIFIAKKSMLEKDYKEIESCIFDLLKRTEIMKK